MYMPIEEDIERIIGGTPRDMALYNTAFTHKSARKGTASYDRLEFLGDSVLGLVVTEHLFTSYPDLSEGQLAKLRAAVVNSRATSSLGEGMTRDLRLKLVKGVVLD